MINAQPIRFIEEPIEVVFYQQPALEKRAGCPDGFVWRGNIYMIEELVIIA